MTSNGNSEAASENRYSEESYRKLFKDADEKFLLEVVRRGNPEPAKAARAILEEKEAASKKRKGRPRLLSRVNQATLQEVCLNAKSARSLQNMHYCLLAMAILGGDDRFKWLFDKDAGQWKKGILAELGRFEDDEELRAYAEALCNGKPKTKDAITRLRRVRLDRAPASDTLTLANKIIHLINQYATEHPDLTKEQMLDALATARRCVESSDV